MKALNDEFTIDVGQLGSQDQADSVLELIRGCETPFSLGISGRWGSGKTSVMRYLMHKLGGRIAELRMPGTMEAVEDLLEVEEKKKIPELTKEEEQANKYLHCIWFNPWDIETHQEPIVVLLQRIRNHFSDAQNFKREFSKELNRAC